MSSIDFPDNVTKFKDDNGLWWNKINGSWVKQLNYVQEANNDGVEYCRKDSLWSPIAYPIPEDVPEASKTYGRRDNDWFELTSAMGPIAPDTDGVLYGVRDGAWDIFSAEDFTGDIYSKDEMDALLGLKAAADHTHDARDPAVIMGLKALAFEDDAGIIGDDLQWVRQNRSWAPLAAPVIPVRTKSITIIDPIHSDDALIAFMPEAVTVSAIQAVALGSGTQGAGGKVIFNVLYADAANGAVTYPTQLFGDSQVSDNTPTGQRYVPNITKIPAGSWIWIQLDEGINTETTMFHLTMIYTKTGA